MRPFCAAMVLFSVLCTVYAQPMPPWVNEVPRYAAPGLVLCHRHASVVWLQTIPGPAHPHLRDMWLASMQRLRTRELASVNYSNAWYTNSTQLLWTATR